MTCEFKGSAQEQCRSSVAVLVSATTPKHGPPCKNFSWSCQPYGPASVSVQEAIGGPASMALPVSRLHLSPRPRTPESSRAGLLGGARYGRQAFSKPLPCVAGARLASLSSRPRFLAELAFERWYRANNAFRAELGAGNRQEYLIWPWAHIHKSLLFRVDVMANCLCLF